MQIFYSEIHRQNRRTNGTATSPAAESAVLGRTHGWALRWTRDVEQRNWVEVPVPQFAVHRDRRRGARLNTSTRDVFSALCQSNSNSYRRIVGSLHRSKNWVFGQVDNTKLGRRVGQLELKQYNYRQCKI